MAPLLSDVDPDGLLEYSVVYTDRALNHMSARFQRVMQGLDALLKQAYRARATAIVPGSGTFGMEAVARQFATARRVLVLRHGWFSYRWSQIFEAGRIPAAQTVLKARRQAPHRSAPWAPPPIDEVQATIASERPDLVFAAHVETASGIVLPDADLARIAAATHAAGGLFVVDAIASGALWLDMEAIGIDILVSAPQKAWSGSPCCAFVMLSERAQAALAQTTSSSFACDLKRWAQIMDAYLGGGYAYHSTMPTDALARTLQAMRETAEAGFEPLRERQRELGQRVRAALAARGFASVAAAGFEAPCVVVSYTDDDAIASGRRFAELGLQTAAGVPLQCDEGPEFKTFRIGLFGLAKLQDVAGTVARLEAALERLTARG
jgi:aspartate aminotransferase-like enzyme